MKREKVAVSACLLGVSCKYNGGDNLNLRVLENVPGMEIIPICPEVFGGLGTPRIPNEIQKDQRVLNKEGIDVTENFISGAKETLKVLKKSGCRKVILKDGSPSCGYKTVYDGTFTQRKIPGMGITASFLLKHGIEIIDLDNENQPIG